MHCLTIVLVWCRRGHKKSIRPENKEGRAPQNPENFADLIVAPPTLGFGLLLACYADAEVLHRHLINLYAVRLFITFALCRAARVDREVRVRANTPRWQLRFVLLPPPFFFFLLAGLWSRATSAAVASRLFFRVEL